MEALRKFLSYLTFRKEDDGGNINLRMMHGINRISILMALVAMIVLLVRYAR